MYSEILFKEVTNFRFHLLADVFGGDDFEVGTKREDLLLQLIVGAHNDRDDASLAIFNTLRRVNGLGSDVWVTALAGTKRNLHGGFMLMNGNAHHIIEVVVEVNVLVDHEVNFRHWLNAFDSVKSNVGD